MATFTFATGATTSDDATLLKVASTVAEPPAFSMAAIAVSEKAFARKLTADFNSPRPKILTKSDFEVSPLLYNTPKSIFVIPVLSKSDCIVSKLIALYSIRLIFLKPNLGTRRCNGI